MKKFNLSLLGSFLLSALITNFACAVTIDCTEEDPTSVTIKFGHVGNPNDCVKSPINLSPRKLDEEIALNLNNRKILHISFEGVDEPNKAEKKKIVGTIVSVNKKHFTEDVTVGVVNPLDNEFAASLQDFLRQ